MTDPFADRSGRIPLYDAAGALVLVYTSSSSPRSHRPWADDVWRPRSIPTTTAVECALGALGGWRFSTSDSALADALRSAGAGLERCALTMTHDLAEVAPAEPCLAKPPPKVRVEVLTPAQLARHADRLGSLNHAAYACLPDWRQRDEQAVNEQTAVDQLRAIARGRLLGPMLPVSTVALDGQQLAGACLVVEREGGPPFGGPWIIDLFVDPVASSRGIGRALLGATLAAARTAGLDGLSLVVTRTNARAHRLYWATGFREAGTSWTLTLPE